MIVTGLNSNRFCVNNPIPVTIASSSSDYNQGASISITITKLVTHSGDMQFSYPPFKVYPTPSGITIDLAPIIKGLMPYPYITESTFQNPTPNYQNFSLLFSENQGDTSSVFLQKAFFRAFKRTKSNSPISLAVNDVLSPSDRIPIWSGYPATYFTINASNQIIPSDVIPSNITKQMKLPSTCNPFYIRFMNSLGGYSNWMFNSWGWSTQSKGAGIIKRTTNKNNRSLGFREDNNVTVDTRVKRDFYPLMRDLIVSPVIQVYNQFDMTWLKIELNDTSFDENNFDDLQEFTCSFDLALNTNPEVIW